MNNANGNFSHLEQRNVQRQLAFRRSPPSSTFVMPLSRRIPSIFRRRTRKVTRHSGRMIRPEFLTSNVTHTDTPPVTTMVAVKPSSKSSSSSSRITCRLTRTQFQAITEIYSRISASFHTRHALPLRYTGPRISPLLLSQLLRTYKLTSPTSTPPWIIVRHPFLSRILSMPPSVPRPLSMSAQCSTMVASTSWAVTPSVPCRSVSQVVIREEDDPDPTKALCCASSGQSQHVINPIPPEPSSAPTIPNNLTLLLSVNNIVFQDQTEQRQKPNVMQI